MQKSLKDFIIGQSGVIVNVGGDGKIRRRLFDMGVTPGAKVTLVKKAPLGDPMEVTMRGYELTLRKAEAEVVTLEVDEREEKALLEKKSKPEKKEKKGFSLFRKKEDK